MADDKLNEMIAKNKAAEKNKAAKKQLIAVLHKYKGGGDYKQIAELMKSKFGVDMVFHTKEGHDKPYGYTVIDHKNKTVYKGSELMNLKELLEPNEKQIQSRTAREIIHDFTSKDNIQNNPDYTLNELKEVLNKYGFTVDSEGNVKAGQEQLFKMGFDFNRLKYNTMLREALKFHVTNAQEAKIIGSMFQVRPEHLHIEPDRNKEVSDYYLNVAKAYASTGKVDDSVADEIKVYKHNNMFFVVDLEMKEVYGIKDSRLNQRLEDTSAVYSTATVGRDESVSVEVAKGIMNTIFGMLAADSGGGASDDKRKRRKRHY